MAIIDDARPATDDQPEEASAAVVEVPLAAPRDLAGSSHDDVVTAQVGVGFVKGMVIGTFVVLAVCGGIALYAGSSLGPALGIGLFAAFWGGPGFGGMLGAVSGYTRAVGH